MKQRSLMKKLSAVLLTTAMTVSTFPQLSTPVFAADTTNQLPTVEQFATVEELKKFNTDDTSVGENKNPARVYFGNNNQQWWIAGSQNENVTLFAASPLAIGQQFEPNSLLNKTYESSWNCSYQSETPSDVFPNHYGASPLRDTLQGFETSYFTNEEHALMNPTTIYTNDSKNNQGVYSTTDKLYLAYGDYADYHITVGTNDSDNLNTGLRVDKDYWGSKFDYFWLRAPHPHIDLKFVALIAFSSDRVGSDGVGSDGALVPAFELNLSNVSFASAVPAASSGGNLEVQDVIGKDVDNNGKVTLHGAFTLRYRADNLGSAEISFDKSKVTLTGVPKDKDVYLVVQNSAGAKAKQVTDQTTPVSPTDMGLDSFANCKVWLETTDTTNRITYATLATDGQPIELPSEIIFSNQHIGYEDVSTQTVEITNISNVEVSNINAVLTGKNADKFTLNTAGMQTTLAPNGTTSFTVKPNNDLGAGTYTAQVQVTGETGVSKTIPVSFTVEGHTYKDTWVKDETSHWHECDCNAKADEETHTFKWVVDKEATDKEKGSKHEECSVCGYKKASVEIPVLTPTNPEKPNTDKPSTNKPNNDKGSVETGDQTNVGLFTSLLMISALGIAVLTVWKKKKALENK